MNETSSGVAISAAKIRSPSFSRSSSSTTTTALPAAMSATARSISSKPSARVGSAGAVGAPFTGPAPPRAAPTGTPPRYPAVSRSTYLAITSTSRLTVSPGARNPSVVCAKVVGISATVNASGAHRGHGQRHPVHRDRALLHHVPGQLGGQAEPHLVAALAGRAGEQRGHPVDVALHDVPAEPAAGRQRPLQVDPGPGGDRGQAGRAQGLRHQLDGEGAVGAAVGVDRRSGRPR